MILRGLINHFFKMRSKGSYSKEGEWEETRVSTIREVAGSPDWNLRKSRLGVVHTLRNLLKETPQNRLALAPGNASSPAAHERPLAIREGSLSSRPWGRSKPTRPYPSKGEGHRARKRENPESDPCRGACFCNQDVTSFRRARRISLPSPV